MAPLCSLRDAAGAPRTGVHAVRVLDVAVFDVAATLLGAWALSRAAGWSLPLTVAGAFAAGVVAHRVCGVATAVDVALFGRA